MKRIFALLLALGALCTLSARTLKCSYRVTVAGSRPECPVVIRDVPGWARSAVVSSEGSRQIPSQLDERLGELVFVADISGARDFRVVYSSEPDKRVFKSRVHAQMWLKNPDKSLRAADTLSSTQNDMYHKLHHHGPAFESELVAYRLYFDKKQTVDIYGKFNKGFEIKESQFYPTDEQLARGFGDDVLLVGGSCGLGALKGWDGKKSTHIEPVSTLTERIIAYGPVRTIAEIEVTDWQYQGSELRMTNRYTLYGGHRDVFVETFFEEPLKDEIFCTGVIDIKGSVSYSDHKGLIGCWGTDWPVNDTVKYAKETVGLGTYIPQKYVKAEVKDKANYLYTIGAKGSKYFTHNITFTSMKETFGYKTPEAWFAYIREWKEELEHPAVVKVMK